MQIQQLRVLRGPNIWSTAPVLEAWVEIGDVPESLTTTLLGLAEGLRSSSSHPGETGGSPDGERDFPPRPSATATPAAALLELALEFQRLLDRDDAPGWSRPTTAPGVVRLAFAYQREEFARASLEAARSLAVVVLVGGVVDVVAEARRLLAFADGIPIGVIVPAILAEARQRGIPALCPYADLMNSLVVFGQGVRRRHFAAAKTYRTAAVAVAISDDKELTKTILKEIGVPVPVGRPVNDAEDAWSAARELGLPVVIKPQDSDWGNGVSLNLTDHDRVVAAYHAARAYSGRILVEKQVVGREHRLLVVGDRVVAAVLREPPQVVGDGRSTIAMLLAAVNRDPRRGDGRRTALTTIELDATVRTVLAEQGHSPDSVPEAGARVLIRRNTHRWTGGTAVDVTDRVHPEVAARAVEAARAVGLDVAGIDLLARDIGLPLEAQEGAIVEVNAEPALSMHMNPASGTPRPVARAILGLMFPEGDEGRIPVVAVTGTNGKTTTTRLIAHLLREPGRTIGMTCSDGIYVDQRRIVRGDCSGPQSARSILLNPRVAAAVLETARGGILTGGLGFDRCGVAVVTNLGAGDHLGSHGVETFEELAEVKAVVVRAVAPEGAVVLNAEDPRVAAMATISPAPVLYFARDETLPAIVHHRSRGGQCVFVRGGWIVQAQGNREVPVASLAGVPLTHQGRVAFQVENVLAATAAAWALGVPIAAIRDRLGSFSASPERTPGRFNVFEARGGTLIVDYAHNATAIEALARAIDLFPASGRTIVYSAAGNRRDDDIVRQGEALGRGFERVVIYEDQCNYRRPEGEATRLLRRGLDSAPRVAEVLEVRGERGAIEAALARLEPGHIVVLVPESIEETIEVIARLLDGPGAVPQATAARGGSSPRRVELTNVRRSRIFVVPYRNGQAGTPYAVLSGCVVECLDAGRTHEIPDDVPATFALSGPGRPGTESTPKEVGPLITLTGFYRMPSGEVAAVYGADVNPIT